jgi:hypothetical protein
MNPLQRFRLWHLSGALLLAAFCAFAGNAGRAAPETPKPSEQKLLPQPDGDRLVRLLKQIADEGALIDPERMAKELRIAMTFETKPSDWQSKGCDAGGSYKSFLVTRATVGESWFTSGSEGAQDMKVPASVTTSADAAGAPQVGFSLYRTVDCRTPDHTTIEASLDFSNLSGFSCITPERLQRLIGAEHRMATDGVSFASYTPPATDDYSVRLEFDFRAGGTCAAGASIRQRSRLDAREQRAFVKWRACLDKARTDYCAAHPGLQASDQGALRIHEFGACESRQAYIDREPPGGAPPASWPQFKPISDNPCDD